MWIPKNEDEIKQEFNNKQERQYLEAKRTFVKSHEIAESICAMANSGGGTIVIGVDENKKTRVFSLTPVEITEQQNETIVYQAIKDYLTGLVGVDVHVVYERDDRKKGYVVILVPSQSDRLYSVNGKFYKRVGNINPPMSSSEVEAFYKKSSPILDPSTFIEEEIKKAPFPIDELGEIGYMFAVIKPIDQIVLRTETRKSKDDWFKLAKAFCKKVIPEDGGFDPSCKPHLLDMNDSSLSINSFLFRTQNLELDTKQGTAITMKHITYEILKNGYVQHNIDFGGTLSLLCAPIASVSIRGAKFFHSKTAEQHLANFIQFGGLLYGDTPTYKGDVFVALGLVGIKDSRNQLHLSVNSYAESKYKLHKRVSATQLFDEGRSIAKDLLDPLIQVMNQ